jgi:hypothetical protein
MSSILYAKSRTNSQRGRRDERNSQSEHINRRSNQDDKDITLLYNQILNNLREERNRSRSRNPIRQDDRNQNRGNSNNSTNSRRQQQQQRWQQQQQQQPQQEEQQHQQHQHHQQQQQQPQQLQQQPQEKQIVILQKVAIGGKLQQDAVRCAPSQDSNRPIMYFDVS